jgi:hypothetical protein
VYGSVETARLIGLVLRKTKPILECCHLDIQSLQTFELSYEARDCILLKESCISFLKFSVSSLTIESKLGTLLAKY